VRSAVRLGIEVTVLREPEDHQVVQIQGQRRRSLHGLGRSVLRVLQAEELLGVVEGDFQRPAESKQLQNGLGRVAQVGAEEAVILSSSRRVISDKSSVFTTSSMKYTRSPSGSHSRGDGGNSQS
jgi:hypothetical protein